MEFITAGLLVLVCACAALGCRETDRPAPYVGSCTRYLACAGGSWKEEKCGWMKRFDEPTRTCRIWWKATCSKVECNEEDTDPVIADCASYKLCVNGKWTKVTCPQGLKYDVGSKKCSESYDCSGTPICVKGDRKEVPEDCKKFMECDKGKWWKQSCSTGSSYKADEKKCKFVWWKGCGPKSDVLIGTTGAHTPGTKTTAHVTTPAANTTAHVTTPAANTTAHVTTPAANTTAVSTTTTVTSTTPDVTSSVTTTTAVPPTTVTTTRGPTCPNGTNLPIEGACKDYLVCDPKTGDTTPSRCGSCKNFDPKARKCVWVWKYQCWDGPVTEPTPLTPPPDCKDGDKKAVDCKNYKECQGGKWTDQSCTWPKKFDTVSMKCVWYGAKC